jgi:hypothetical protein
MAKRHREELTVGDDAFLDTVANLVGILIILVVIVSTGTKSAADLLATQRIAEAAEAMQKPMQSASNIQKDLLRQVDQLNQHTIEVAYRKAERDAMLDQVLQAKALIDEEADELDDQSKSDVEQSSRLSEMEKELAKLLQQQGEVDTTAKPPIVLQHLPTPMAKTVFGKEMHIMVQGNSITVIPWDRLVDALKLEVRARVKRGMKNDQVAGELDPIDGFVMAYSLVSKRGLVSNGGSTAMAQMIELDKFELEPGSDVFRESLQQCLGVNGRFRLELSAYSPRETTVTAWVYPDSFETFRQLKEMLFVEGFMTAARPLPEGIRIGASPRGSQSTAQ